MRKDAGKNGNSMLVDNWFVTPFSIKPEDLDTWRGRPPTLHAGNSEKAESVPRWEGEIIEVYLSIMPGDGLSDNEAYIYLSVYLWASAVDCHGIATDAPITDYMIDHWLCDHFQVVDIQSYKRHQ